MNMKTQSMLLLLGFALAGSHIMAPPPALMSSLKERIELADIEALIKSDNAKELKSIIDSNKQIIENSDSTIYRNEAFKLAVNQNRASVIALFLKELDVNVAFNQNKAIIVASTRGHTDIARMLLERPEVNAAAQDNQPLLSASLHGYTDIVRMLLQRPEVNAAAKDNQAIQLAIMNGHTDIVRMLLERPEVNPGAQNNEAIQVASVRGYTDIVRMLLERSDVNPGAQDNEAIQSASTRGYTEIVQMLLQRSEVNPAAQQNHAIQVASLRGHIEIVRMLLERPEVNPGAQGDKALINAIKNGHTQIIKLLLKDSRVDPTAQSSLPFRIAVHTNPDVVKLLLADKRANPADLNNAAILSMNLEWGRSFNQRYETLKLLLEDGRADPSVHNNELLTKFRSGENPPTKELLKQDERVKSIEFLNGETDRLTTTMFLNLFNSPLKWNTASYTKSVFADRPNPLVASYISDLLEILPKEAKSIKNLDDFDTYIYKMHKDVFNHRINQEADNNLETSLSQRKFEFLWKYYSGTLGYKDHFNRFQEMTVSLKRKRKEPLTD